MTEFLYTPGNHTTDNRTAWHLEGEREFFAGELDHGRPAIRTLIFRGLSCGPIASTPFARPVCSVRSSVMTPFQPINTNRGVIASLQDAREFINTYVANSKRTEPHWDSAIADVNAAIVDFSRTGTARNALHKALADSPPANVKLL
jgi:hypothetical protein